MKKTLTLFFGMCLAIFAMAQVKYDNVLFTNGVEYSGKVTSVTGDSIGFTHKNETLVYMFPKSDVFRIEFASGRVEILTSIEKDKGTEVVVHTQKPVAPATSPAGKNNRMIAILPFRYVNNRNYNPEMPYTVQAEYYKQARIQGSLYEYQDPSLTNAILIRKGINAQQLRGYTMNELCEILGVGYVVTGTVNVVTRGVNATSTSSTHNGTTIFGKPTTVTTQNTVVKDNLNTTVEINIFNDNGRLLYNRSKQSVWSTPDAYKLTISYLIKRIPMH